jgi:adenine deaminase
MIEGAPTSMLAYPPDLRAHVLEVALGRAEPDLVIRDCRVLVVHTGEWRRTNLVVAGGRIASWDSAITAGKKTLNAGGLWAIPGLIDAHMHVEASMLTVGELARLLVPRGVTALMADLHEIANVLGQRGVEVMAGEAAHVPLRVFLQIPAALDQDAAEEMLRSDRTVSFGEASFPRIARSPDKFMHLYAAADRLGHVVTGHAAGLRLGPRLSGLTAIGQADDHECETPEEAWDRVRMGQRVMIREGSAARNLDALVPLVRDHPEAAHMFMFCTDDRHVTDILERGQLDDCARMAIQAGLAPELAIRMASLTCAVHHRVDAHLGSLAPGRLADVSLVTDPCVIQPAYVLVGGELVAEGGKALWSKDDSHTFPASFLESVNIGRELTVRDLSIPGVKDERVTARVIRVRPGQIVKGLELEQVEIRDGSVHDGARYDILKAVVVERHRGSGHVGVGLVSGFGLRRGALASSVAHDRHNIIAIGVTDADILAAVRAVERAQGGLVVVHEGEVEALVPLPLAGLMSLQTPEEVSGQLAKAETAARELGCELPAPFMSLSFVPLIGLPEVGLSEVGLLDSTSYEPIALIADESTATGRGRAD